MDDPYKILGVDKSASQEAIRKAYRKLAKKLHPDLNPGDKKAEAQFKEVSAAYDLLGDAEKRARFDRGEIDANGAEKPEYQYYKEYGSGPGATHYSGAGNFDDISDVFADLFGRRAENGASYRQTGQGAHNFPMAGRDIRLALQVDFIDAVKGAKRRVTMPNGSAINMTIPAGVKDGQLIRLKGKGEPGHNNGPDGDALIEIHISQHKIFQRDGNDIIIDLPITIDEAVLGGKVETPTLDGKVRVSVPAGANCGQTLRLRGKGIKGLGDQLCILKIVLPETIDQNLIEFFKQWREKNNYNPREAL